jgi:hypothetical protein
MRIDLPTGFVTSRSGQERAGKSSRTEQAKAAQGTGQELTAVQVVRRFVLVHMIMASWNQ